MLNGAHHGSWRTAESIPFIGVQKPPYYRNNPAAPIAIHAGRSSAPTVDGRDDALVVVVPRKTRPLVSGRCPAHQYPDRLDTCWCDL